MISFFSNYGAFLEFEFDAELHGARAACAGDVAIVAAAVEVGTGIVELRRVGDTEGFATELQRVALAKFDEFEE